MSIISVDLAPRMEEPTDCPDCQWIRDRYRRDLEAGDRESARVTAMVFGDSCEKCKRDRWDQVREEIDRKRKQALEDLGNRIADALLKMFSVAVDAVKAQGQREQEEQTGWGE